MAYNLGNQLSKLTADETSTIDYIAGVDANGNVPTSDWQKDTYGANAPTKTFGNGATIKIGFFSSSAQYAFSATEKDKAWQALQLWSGLNNISFSYVTDASLADVVFTHTGDTYNGTVVGTGTSYSALTTTPTSNPGIVRTQTGMIQIDNTTVVLDRNGNPTTTLKYGDIGSYTVSGGYGIDVLVHEVGHLVGLGHAGNYNGTVTAATQQRDTADVRTWSVMSYIDPVARLQNGTLDVPKYQSSYPDEVKDTYWDNYNGLHTPYTPMGLDIIAAQRLNGAPSSTMFDGNDTFGFNSTIKYTALDGTQQTLSMYDFTVDTDPVVTLYDYGTNNTLDLSGFAYGSKVNLNDGTFSSVDNLTNNIFIEWGTIIDHAVGGAYNDSFIVNAVDDTIDGGAGTDTVQFAGARASYTITRFSGGLVTVKDSNPSRGGTERLTNIETLKFSDTTVAVSSLAVASDTYRWRGGGGQVNAAAGWQDVTTGQNPAANVPGRGDQVVFGTSAGASTGALYGPLSADGVTVEAGTNWDFHGALTASTFYASGRFDITGGTLLLSGPFGASGLPSAGALYSSATWSGATVSMSGSQFAVTASLLNGLGTAVLSVQGASDVTDTQTVVGYRLTTGTAAAGSIVLSGSGTKWHGVASGGNASALRIGVGGAGGAGSGLVTVTDHAVWTEQGDINVGEAADSIGRLTLTQFAHVDAGHTLTIAGTGGEGHLYLDTGSELTAASLAIGTYLGAYGVASINGRGTIATVSGGVTLGGTGTGELDMLTGGLLSAGSLTLATGGTLLLDASSNFNVGSGAVQTNGAVAVGAGATLAASGGTVSGNVRNDGTIAFDGAAATSGFRITGSISGSGAISIGKGALTIGGSYAGQRFTFTSSTSALKLAAPSGSAALSGFRPGDVLDFSGRAVSVEKSGTTLSVKDSGNAVLATFTLDAAEAALTYSTASDGAGGTKLSAAIDRFPPSAPLLTGIAAGGNSIYASHAGALFSRTAPSGGVELWVSDGSSAGTTLVRSINAGAGSTSPSGFTPIGDGHAVFRADDGAAGPELWVTDGTAAGTSMLRDIAPGAAGSGVSKLTALGTGRSVFVANDGTNGYELWTTDGTAAGTSMLRNINASGDANIGELTTLGNLAVFSADSGSSGTSNVSLWVTDGTAAGTSELRDASALAFTSPSYFEPIGNGRTVFQGSNAGSGSGIYVTDGTTAGTSLLRSSAYLAFPTSYGDAALPGGRALLQIMSGTTGYEPWVTDGTAAGTSLVKDIVAGSGASYAQGFTALGNGRSVFNANDGTTGTELWVTDGTAANTSLLKDIWAGTGSSYPGLITRIANGRALFLASNPAVGNEVWVTDGTAAGTSLLDDIRPGVSNSFANYGFTVLGDGRALFSAIGTGNRELWITDGTTAGTSQLLDAAGASITATFDGTTAFQLRGTLPAHTTNGAVTLSGNTDAGSAVVLFDGTAQVGSAVADGTGAFSIAPATALGLGTHSLTLKATDPAGNASAPSAPYVVVIDPPVAPPVITTVLPDTGASATDGLTRTGGVTVYGTAPVGAIVTVYDGATSLGTTVPSGAGQWQLQLGSTPLSAGAHSLTAKAQLTGPQSNASNTYVVTVDLTPPSAPAISGVSASGQAVSGGIAHSGTVVVTGTAEAGAAVALYDGATQVGTATADGTGAWLVTPAAALSAGSHSLSVTATDLAGNASAASAAYALLVQGAAGHAQPARSDVNADGTSDILLQAGGTVVDWIMQAGVYGSGNILTTGAAGFAVVGTGDFNADGTADVALQGGGTVVDWIMKDGVYQSGNVITTGAAGFAVVGTGDFNGDGTSDVLLQGGGTVVDWIMKDGVYQSGNVITTAAAGYTIVGTGDFDGDGTSDVLLQSGGTVVEWLMQGGAYKSGAVITTGAAGFAVVGTGDFNGDGTADVLLQGGADSGTVVDWIMKDGAYQSGNILTTAAAGFTVRGTGDYNGDGTSDIALQGGGTVVDWIMKDGAYQSGNVITTGATGFTVV